MTTIAYKDGVFAYDSRRTSGDVITCDNVEKLLEYEGVKFLFCGAIADFPALRDAYLGKPPTAPIEAAGFVIDGGVVWQVGHDEGSGFWKSALLPGVEYAVGSGSHFAMGAMAMGASAKKAVKVACTRDVYSGGKVRTFKVV